MALWSYTDLALIILTDVDSITAWSFPLVNKLFKRIWYNLVFWKKLLFNESRFSLPDTISVTPENVKIWIKLSTIRYWELQFIYSSKVHIESDSIISHFFLFKILKWDNKFLTLEISIKKANKHHTSTVNQVQEYLYNNKDSFPPWIYKISMIDDNMQSSPQVDKVQFDELCTRLYTFLEYVCHIVEVEKDDTILLKCPVNLYKLWRNNNQKDWNKLDIQECNFIRLHLDIDNDDINEEDIWRLVDCKHGSQENIMQHLRYIEDDNPQNTASFPKWYGLIYDTYGDFDEMFLNLRGLSIPECIAEHLCDGDPSVLENIMDSGILFPRFPYESRHIKKRKYVLIC